MKGRRYGFKFLQILQGKYGPAKPTCPVFIVRLGTGCNRNRQRVHEIRKGIRYESYGPRSNRRGRGRRAINDHRDDGGLLLCRRGNWQHRRCSTAMCYGGNFHGRRAFSGHEQRDKAAISPFGAYTVSANNTETSQRENELFRSKMKDRLLLLVTGAGCAAVAQFMWSQLPSVTIGLILLGFGGSLWRERRKRRTIREGNERRARRDERIRIRQLARLTRTLAALRDQRNTLP